MSKVKSLKQLLAKCQKWLDGTNWSQVQTPPHVEFVIDSLSLMNDSCSIKSNRIQKSACKIELKLEIKEKKIKNREMHI